MNDLHKVFLVVFVVLLSSFVCITKVITSGVSHVCRTSDGRVGRCRSRDTCDNHAIINLTASTASECSNGLGKAPYVCCNIGTNMIYPDDRETLTAYNMGLPAPSQRSAAPPTKPIRFIYPDDKLYVTPQEVNFQTYYSSQTNVTIRINDTSSTARFGERKSSNSLFPKPPECGPSSISPKISNGGEAEFGEFPWLVNLEYRTTNGTLEIACAGSIINHRYVLTAAHCVKGDIEKYIGQIESFRAGDHNIQTDVDCDEEGSCIPQYERYTIIKTIVHGRFHLDAKKRAFYDIALLKTNRKIAYYITVSPVCLPDIFNPMPPLRNFTHFTVAGWGADINVTQTDEKRIVDVPYYSSEECQKYIQVKPEQICAGGLHHKNICNGDSGGSLCRQIGQTWLIEGIVSYGRKGTCGIEIPSVFTKVRSFLTWIYANVDEN